MNMYVVFLLCEGYNPLRRHHALTCPRKKHIKSLVHQTAMHILSAGGVVRKIDYLGLRTLPQRIKRHGSYQNVGE
jgi:small subunit ribosomal protein S6